ncbi:hypothetical protein VTH06DRAFT_7872 [Thermothelomyces fergusii]
MFLHSGASLHGHEYSTRSPSGPPSPGPLRSPLLRSTLSPPKQRARASTEGTPTPTPILRQRPVSDFIPREPTPAVRFREPRDDLPPTPPPIHEDSMSESELSDVAFSIDGALSPRSPRPRRPRRTSRKGTTYCLGYPAPRIIGKTKVVQKVLLPRLLLQLQQVSQEGRSKPVLEAFPALRITGPVVAPRLAKKFPGIFGVKRHLGCDDIVLVRRDDGDASGDGPDSEDDEDMENRELLAVFSPLKHSNEAELVLNDGSVWLARMLPNGNFDFVHTDADGKATTARWARRQAAGGAVSPAADSSAASPAGPRARYTFSIINPLSRRHPVMATLTPSALNVFDTYTSVCPSHARQRSANRPRRSQSVTSPPASPPPTSARPAPCAPSTVSSSGSTSEGESDSAICIPASPEAEVPSRTVHRIDERTKTLISITAFWVCLQSGWPQSHRSAPASGGGETAASAASPAAASTRARGRCRRHTWTTRSSSGSDTPHSPTADDAPLVARGDQPPRETAKEAASRKRTSMPVLTSTYASGDDIGAESSAAAGVPPACPPAGKTTAAAAPDGRPHVRSPRRATSLSAIFMRKRTLASSGSDSTVDRGEAAEEAGTVSAKPQQSLPSLAGRGEGGTTASGGTAPLGGGEKAHGAGGVGMTSDSATSAGRSGGGSKKCGNARSKLVRWMSKLRSSSSR